MSNREKPAENRQEQAASNASPSPSGSFELEVARQTDVGRVRSHNEDFLDYFVPPDPRLRERKGVMYLVADGMGGHQAGEVASKEAVESVKEQYYADANQDVGSSLVRAYRTTHRTIYERGQSDPARAGMGTTLVAAVVLGQKVFVANVGDSRAYIIGKKGIAQITEDHSWVAEQVRAGLLKPEQARQHPQRNLVTRSLGSKPTVEVDLFEGSIAEGDALVLCTDGLTNYVEDREIEEAVRAHPPQDAVQLLVEKAKERGGSDNISVLVVKAQPVAVATPVSSRKPAAEFPWIPVAAGVIALISLLALAWFVVRPLLLPKPTPTVQASATGTPAAVPAPSLVPSITLTVPVPAVEVSATLTPLQASDVPTATLTANVTATSTATATRTVTVTPRSRATSTPIPAPRLLAPKDNPGSLQGFVTFQWQGSGSLGPNNGYQVLIWKEGQPHNGAAESTESTEQLINLDQVPQLKSGGAGLYWWSVVVVRRSTDARLSQEASPRRFSYSAPRPSPAFTVAPLPTVPKP